MVQEMTKSVEIDAKAQLNLFLLYCFCFQHKIQSLSETLDSGMKKSRRAVELDKQPAKALKLYEPKLTEK